ncbi:MAG: ABC transporter permease subunit, partial [Olsenella sp.]|nr:ABC transporter permease subunit [Olsenella sp.]
GLITHELLGLSVSPYGPVGVVVMQSVFFCAINVLLILSTIRNIDPSVIDAARDLGASPSTVARRVVVPLALPSVGACLLLTFVRSLADYGTPVVIGGSFETISTAIYEQVVGYSDLAGAAVLGILLCAIAVVVYACYAALIARSRRRVAGTATSAFEMVGDRRAAQMTLDGPLGVVCSVVSWAFVAFMVMQYATIVHASLTQGISWTAPLTDANFRHLAEYEALPLARSLWFALASAAISCVLGFVCAYLLQRGRAGAGAAGHAARRGGRAGRARAGVSRKAQALLGFAITMPYMLPGTCVGLGYILAFNRPPLKLTGTAVIVVLVLAFKQLSISQQAFSNELAQLDPHLEEAARDVGATRLASALAVVVPSVRRAVAVSFMNAFSSAMVAYSAVLFLIAPGNKTAIFELFDQLSGGKYGQAAATSLVIVAITLVVDAALAWLFLGRRRRQHADA